jgi:MFS family permease
MLCSLQSVLVAKLLLKGGMAKLTSDKVVATAQDFFPNWKQIRLVTAISKVAYFFTSTALLQGTGNLIWMPLVNKYGRRPIYLISYTIYLACAIWAACTHSYASFLAARILMGFGSGAAETSMLFYWGIPVTTNEAKWLRFQSLMCSFYMSGGLSWQLTGQKVPLSSP